MTPDPRLLDAQLWAESNYNPRAVSPAGAQGIAQIMPATARAPGFGVAPVSDPFNPDEAKRFQRDYMGAMLRRYNGDTRRALAAYNWGAGNVDKWNGDLSSLPAETRGYIQRIEQRIAQAGGGTMTDATPDRGALLREALKRGLISREALEAEAKRRGLIVGNPPPEGMTAQEAAEAAMAQATEGAAARQAYRDNPVSGGIASAARGVPFVGEYLDEAAGVIGGDTEQVRLAREGFEQANPSLATGLQVATGIATGVPLALAAAPVVGAAAPASMLGQVGAGIVAGAGAGAVEGGVSGYGAGDDGNRLASAGQRAAIGGALGGAVGGAAPLMAQGAANLVRTMRGRPDAAAAARLGMSPESAAVVGRMIDADDPARAAARIAAAGPEGMVADAGPTTSGLLDSVVQTPGPGSRIAQEAVEGRATAASREMGDALDTALGPVTAAAKPAYSAQTKALYSAAYAKPIDYAAKAGQEIDALLPRVPAAIIQRANRLMQVSGEQSQQIMATIGPDGAVTYQVKPDTRQLDYITRALQDVGRAGDGAGALGGQTAEGQAYMGLAREIRAALKDANPTWANAVDKAATEIGIRQARELGEQALRQNMSRGEVAEEVLSMGAAEREALRKGVRAYIDDVLAGVKRTAANPNTDAREGLKALTELSSRATRDKLRLILGDAPADALMQRIDTAGKAFELRARVAQGSQTAGRLAYKEAVEKLTAPNAVQELLAGSPVASARKLVQSMTNMTPEARRAVEDRIGAEIATVLTGPRGPQAQAAAQELVRLLQRQPVTEALARQIGQAVAATAAASGYQSGMQSLSR